MSAEGLDLLRYGRSAHGPGRAALGECGRAAGPLIDRLAGMCVVVGTVRPGVR